MRPVGVTDSFGLIGLALGEKFRVDRVVAEGGFGVVYCAHHLGLEAPVAVKVLKTPPGLSEKAHRDFVEKFASEAKTIARLRHPNIVQVLDTGIAQTAMGPSAFIVLEWLTGETLAAMLGRRRGRGGQPPRVVIELMRPVFQALAHAHDAGIAHRDIKPANIMLEETRRGSIVKVLDFGIAKIMDAGEEAGTGNTRTTGGLTAFSPRYAAPEQVASARTGPWTDVHALGLILTELLLDHQPYVGTSATDLFREVLQPERSTPARHGIDVGPLEAVLAKALAYKPEDRYRDAGDMLAALDDALARMGPAADRIPGAKTLSFEAVQPSVTTGRGNSTQSYEGTIVPVVEPTTLSPASAQGAPNVPSSSPRRTAAIALAAVTMLCIAGIVTVQRSRSRASSAAVTAPSTAPRSTRLGAVEPGLANALPGTPPPETRAAIQPPPEAHSSETPAAALQPNASLRTAGDAGMQGNSSGTDPAHHTRAVLPPSGRDRTSPQSRTETPAQPMAPATTPPPSEPATAPPQNPAAPPQPQNPPGPGGVYELY